MSRLQSIISSTSSSQPASSFSTIVHMEVELTMSIEGPPIKRSESVLSFLFAWTYKHTIFKGRTDELFLGTAIIRINVTKVSVMLIMTHSIQEFFKFLKLITIIFATWKNTHNSCITWHLMLALIMSNVRPMMARAYGLLTQG